jgi:hypothetical protein
MPLDATATACLSSDGDDIQDHPVRLAVFILACTLAGAVAARADTTSERGASILIFPKIVADGSSDTLVQLANIAEGGIDAFCAYVDGRVGWQSSGFTLRLKAEQPALWSAANGRPAGDAGAAIPAAPEDFRGELLCVEVDPTGTPTSLNRLVGRATLLPDDGAVAAYAAIGLSGSGFNDGDEVLCLGDAQSDTCFLGEYAACPATWTLSHRAEGTIDEQLGAASAVATRITVVPCSQNVRDGEPATVQVRFDVTTELAQRFTTTTPVTCWADLALADLGNGLFDRAMLGADVLQTQLAPQDESGGFVVLGEVERRASAGAVVSRTLPPLHHQGEAVAGDVITLPMGRP